VGAAQEVAEARDAVDQGPFTAFEKYTPDGRPAEVAEQLAGYVDAGCSMLNLKVVAGDDDEAIDATAEIVSLLRAH